MNDDRCYHEWEPAESGYACMMCEETCATCAVCDGASGTSLLICPRCEKRERRILDDIDRILAQAWGADAGTGRRFRLVMVHGTGVGETAREGAEDRLQGWVARWSEHTQNGGDGATDYLRSRIIWAVHNPTLSDWQRYREDLRSIRAAALVEVGLAPEVLPDRCMHCHGKLVQYRADPWGEAFPDGRQEEVKCKRCGMGWSSRKQARISARHHVYMLPQTDPDRVATLTQARRIFPDVPTETMRTWIKRDRAEHARSIAETDAWDDRWTRWEEAGNIGPIPEAPEFYDRQLPERGRRKGKPLYRLGDLRAFAERRADEDRRGRKAG